MKAKLLLLIAMLFVSYAFSQEIEVRKANRLEFSSHHIKTTDNNSFVFWKDYVDSRNDITVQKLNHLGVEQWQSPIRIGVDGYDNFPLAVLRSSDSANILLWTTVDFPQRKLYLAKFDDNGASLWPSSPLMVFSGNVTMPSICMTSNSVGGVFIVYTEEFSSTRLMGISVDGSGNQLWSSNGQQLFNFGGEVQVISTHPDGEGGIIANCLIQNADLTVKTHLIRFSPTGDIIGSNPLVPDGSFNMTYKHCLSTSDGNLLLYNATGLMLNMQKIDNLGNPVSNLQAYPYEGFPLHQDIKIKASINGGVIASWRENTEDSVITKCQSFDGNLQCLWTPAGVTTNFTTYYYNDLELEPDASGGAWIYNYGHIYYVSSIGEAIYSPEGIIIGSANVHRATLVAGQNHLSAFWKEEYNRELSLRKQVINSSGDKLWGDAGTPIVSRLAGNASGSKSFYLDNKYLCLWSDGRIGMKEYKLFYQIINEEGQTYLEVNGRELNPGSDSPETLIEAKVLQGDKLAIVYRSYSSNSTNLLQVIDANGNRLIEGAGLDLGVHSPFIRLMMDCYEQDIYLGWIEESAGYRLKGQRISNQQKQWGEGGITLIEFPQNSSAYLSSLCGRYYIFTLIDNNGNNPTARAALIDPAGLVSQGWNPLGNHLLDPEVYNLQLSFRTQMLDNDLIAIVRTHQGIYPIAVAQRMNPAGNRLWSDAGKLIPETERNDDVSLYVFNGQVNLLYLIGYDPHILRYQRIDGEGNLLWENGGMDIGTTNGFGLSHQLTGFNNGVLTAIFETDGPEESYYGSFYDLGMKYISPQGVPALGNPILCSAPYDQRYISVASSGDHSFVSWTDDRAGLYSEDYAYSSIYGKIVNSVPIAVNDPVLPPQARIVLNQNYPNPFNPSTSISFSLENKRDVSLQVFNMKGQLIKTLCSNKSFLPGRHELLWDGMDDTSHSVSSGIYFYRLSSRGTSLVKKMVLAK